MPIGGRSPQGSDGTSLAKDDGRMAAMSVTRPRVSYADFERAPEDGRRCEIYDGEVFVVPAPVPLHQLVAQNLEDLLRTWVRRHGGIVLLAPVDIVLSDYDVVQPDLVFFTPARQHLAPLEQAIRVRPDLAVEILSPSTAPTDRGRKMQLLARYGVPEYWLVDPAARTLEACRLKGWSYTLIQSASESDVVTTVEAPGLECPLSELFRIDLREPRA